MGSAAARVGDMHMCPMVTPGVPPVPHVGGPILPPGVPTVLIGGMPAAVVGGMATCVGPPDSIIMGSMTVLIGGQPAARMGDPCAHGGVIAVGCPTVLIGDAGGGAASPPAPPAVAAVAPPSSAGSSTNASASHATASRQERMEPVGGGAGTGEKVTEEGSPAHWVEIELVDENGAPLVGERYAIELPGGGVRTGVTDMEGKARLDGIDPGTCRISFPDIDAADWKKA